MSSGRYLIVPQKLNGPTVFFTVKALRQKKMSPELHEVMDVSVKTINFIKNDAANSRCFAKLCEGLEADHVQLLYHSE